MKKYFPFIVAASSIFALSAYSQTISAQTSAEPSPATKAERPSATAELKTVDGDGASVKTGDKYSLLASYKDGDSLEAYYSILGESQKKSRMKAVSKKLLNILRTEKISDGAFALVCSVLTTTADDDAIDALRSFLDSEFRAPHACSVLLGLESSDADEALTDALESEVPSKAACAIISTLAARGERNVDVLSKSAESSDRDTALASTIGLGRIADSDALDALSEIFSKNDFRAATAKESIISIANSAALKRDRSLAWDALAIIPEDEPQAVFARASLKNGAEKTAYLDRAIIEGGANAPAAARAMGNSRKYEDSSEILAAFPSLENKAKIAVISTFIQSPDVRYWVLVAPEMSSPDADLRAEAVYSARFLCSEGAALETIFKIWKSDGDPCQKLAHAVLVENPSEACRKLLRKRADEGDLECLKILIARGDLEARAKLWKTYFADGGMENKNISSAFESSLAYGDLPELAEHFAAAKKIEHKTVDKDGVEHVKIFDQKKELAKLIIRKLARSKDRRFVDLALPKILDGKLDANDPVRQFIESKAANIGEKKSSTPPTQNNISKK